MAATNPPETSAPDVNATPARGWAEPGIGPGWKDKFFYWIMRLGGRARGYHMATFASAWYVLFYPSIRRRCGFYLDRRFPERRGRLRGLIDTYRLVRTYSSTLVDMMVLRVFGSQALAASCPDHGRLRELAAGTQGFVLIHAHVGCWQVGMSALGQFGKNVAVVTLPDSAATSRFDRQTTTSIDPRTGLAGTMKMTEALLRGDILVMMGDRTFGSEEHLVPSQFLAGTVRFPVTPYRLASATGVPVVVLTAPKIRHGAYELRLAKVIDVPPGLGRNAKSYAVYAQQFADCIEQFVRDFPWQYYNFYDTWSEQDVEDSPQRTRRALRAENRTKLQ